MNGLRAARDVKKAPAIVAEEVVVVVETRLFVARWLSGQVDWNQLARLHKGLYGPIDGGQTGCRGLGNGHIHHLLGAEGAAGCCEERLNRPALLGGSLHRALA